MADASELTAALEEWGLQVFLEAGKDLEDVIVDAAPEDTGALKQGIVFRPGSVGGAVNSGTLESERDYSSFVDEGTRPHRIVGNPYLAFSFGGVDVVVRSVNHPGTTGQPFWTENVTDGQWLDSLNRAANSVPLI